VTHYIPVWNQEYGPVANTTAEVVSDPYNTELNVIVAFDNEAEALDVIEGMGDEFAVLQMETAEFLILEATVRGAYIATSSSPFGGLF